MRFSCKYFPATERRMGDGITVVITERRRRRNRRRSRKWRREGKDKVMI